MDLSPNTTIVITGGSRANLPCEINLVAEEGTFGKLSEQVTL